MNHESKNRVVFEAPSIGTVDLGFDVRGNRVRQIVTSSIKDPEVLINILREASVFGEQHGATRSLVRVILPKSLDSDISDIAGFVSYNIEANIPLSGDFSGLSIIYFGKNSKERTPSIETAETERELVRKLLEKDPKSPKEVLRNVSSSYSLEKLAGNLTSADSKRLVEMYNSSFTGYPFDIQETISFMVQQENVSVYAARSIKDGQLYAVCATEQMVLHLSDDRNLVIREMGDSARMPNVRGLNAPLKLMLTQEAFRDRVDLVFCESRAALGAVNAVNYSIGMDYCGFLPQHTFIGGPADIIEFNTDDKETKYGNMNVWALNKDGIKKIGQGLEAASTR